MRMRQKGEGGEREREREKMKAVRMNDTISRRTPWDALYSYYPWMEAFSLSLSVERALLLFSNHVDPGVTAKYLLKRFSD